MTRILEQLLKQRGLDDDFLMPDYNSLFDPFLMHGVKEAVARIEQAKNDGEKIIIYGDYDADGVTSSTVLFAALKDFGCRDIEIMLPDRFKDGYGMNMPVVPEILRRGAKLVITVDCGSGSGEVIDTLTNEGVDCIVTDHHEIPHVPGSAVAVINPKRSDEEYGGRMAGVGVAFTLARALNMHKNGGKCDGQEKWLLDLVAIGTICDSMVLRDENRVMVYYGMKVLGKTRRNGLKELAKKAGANLETVDTMAIGFQLGPRINAAGRMKSATLALDLLLADERARAFMLAEELDELNRERRAAQDAAIDEIAEMIDNSDKVVVVRGDWHEGVIGIIAGRILEDYKKPCLVLTSVGNGRLKGSGRSFGDFSLALALQNCPEGLLLSGGGHAQACGMSIKEDDFARFKEVINAYYESLALEDQEKYLKKQSDIVLDDLSEINLELYQDIQKLEPFGPGNEEPIFEIDAEISEARVLKEKHLSLKIKDKNAVEMKLMGFFAPSEWMEFKSGDKVRVQFRLMKNEWNGRVSIEGGIIGLERLG